MGLLVFHDRYSALMRKDKRRIVEMSRAFGYKSKYFNEDVLFSICQFS